MPTDGVVLDWRGPVSDAEVADLTESHGGNPEPGWWDRIRGHSLGWVSEWLFVDFEPHLESFYLESCGFRPTSAGLVHLTDS
ncbi:hypothetical protein [Promicromonospora sp. NFX87]|uniref:hypothetical protein n=1 Tax=Promicromonospora sp. NFX87 TaxID=3402691 RepID=UPI003AFA2656